jgi:hypothetical protein
MTHSSSTEQAEELVLAKNAAFTAIGRNVVALQQLEAVLRWILSHSQISAPASELKRYVSARSKKLRKEGMGQLANQFGREVLVSGEHRPPVGPEQVEVPHIAISFRISTDAEGVRERKRALDRVVRARNKLVHHLLVEWRPDSLAGTRDLLKRLDSEHRAVLEELELLRTQAGVLREGFLQVGQFLMSAEGQQLLFSEADGNGNLEPGPG